MKTQFVQKVSNRILLVKHFCILQTFALYNNSSTAMAYYVCDNFDSLFQICVFFYSQTRYDKLTI